MIIAALVLLPLSALAAIALDGPLWIAPLAILGLKAVAEFLRHRHAMNALDGDQLYARHGWLSPRMAISSRVKLQSVEIARGPIARRRGYATLHLGLAGGKMALPGIPITRAEELRRAVLASIGKADFSELV